MENNFFAHLDSIRNDPEAIEKAKLMLRRRKRKLTTEIRSGIELTNATSLIWNLAQSEFLRVTQEINNLADYQITDFSGFERHLRASVP